MSGSLKIPFFGIDRQYATIREEILDVTDSVYSSGHVLDDIQTKNFESVIAKMTERRHAVAVNSGTQALTFALRCVDFYSIYHNDKVLIPTQSFAATLNSVVEAGFEPVFCDVDPVTGLLDINRIPIEPNELAAVVYVNLFGNIVDYDKLMTYKGYWNTHNIPIIEDAAQSFGAYYRGVPSGKLGDISCLSFDPTKNLNNYGSGGMVLTDDIDYAEIIRSYRNNGKAHDHAVSGTNSRMSEADCAQMLIKLKYFDQWQARRQLIAEYYTEQLDGYVDLIPVDSKVEHAWSKFVIHHRARGEIKHHLRDYGVEARVHYEYPLHLLDAAGPQGIYEGAEEFSTTCLSLPIYPELTDTEVEYIVDRIREYTF